MSKYYYFESNILSTKEKIFLVELNRINQNNINQNVKK